MSSQPQVFTSTPAAEQAALSHLLAKIKSARQAMPPAEFRENLRTLLLDHPNLSLKDVASALNISKQRVHLLVGRLNRPTCATNLNRPAPRTEQARRLLPELKKRVAMGETAEAVAEQLQISLNQARQIGFLVSHERPAHGTKERAKRCHCWKCRKCLGIVLQRGPKSGPAKRVEVLDWIAWSDPDSDEKLSQVKIARLCQIGQGSVSRIAKGAQ